MERCPELQAILTRDGQKCMHVELRMRITTRPQALQCSRLNLSYFQNFLKMAMPNQRSQRLKSIFLCTTQATQTGRQYDMFTSCLLCKKNLRQQTLKTPI